MEKLGVEETYLNIMKIFYDKLKVTIILNGEKLKKFPKKIRKKIKLSILTKHVVLDVSDRAMSQDKEMIKDMNSKGKIQNTPIYK